MRDRAAIVRTGLRPADAPPSDDDPRVHVSLAALRKLEPRARAITFLPRQPAKSALNGRHASRIRGRGLDFEELRDYLPSDDVRSIDWKVTARTGTPHVRVFTEERDRPTLIVVDQRMSMFFGSRLNMKSVTAAECAAIVAFRILEQGDRVGGIVFGDRDIAEIRPQRSRQALNRLLGAIAGANAALRADAPEVDPVGINTVLREVIKIAPRNHLIVFISDFDQVDDRTEMLLSGLGRRNDVVLGLVTDPTAWEVPQGARLMASDGALQVELDLADETVHRRVSEFVTGRVQRILDWQNRMRLSVLPISSGEETLGQVQRLMGRAPR